MRAPLRSYTRIAEAARIIALFFNGKGNPLSINRLFLKSE